MARITIEAENPAELLAFVRAWLREQEPPKEVTSGSVMDADKIRLAIDHLNGPMVLRFVRDVAEAGKRGERVTVNDTLARDYGVTHGGSMGGALGKAYNAFAKWTGRVVLDRISTRPPVWKIDQADAVIVLAILDERGK